jgi:probable HAF family extracellular repeat protein
VGTNVEAIINHGFLKEGDIYTQFDVPGAYTTFGLGINSRNQVVGIFRLGIDPNNHGYLKDGNAFSTIQPPFPGTFASEATGINNAGDVVGWFEDGSLPNGHGFLKSGGSYTQFDVPGATGTRTGGINDRDQIVGNFFDSAHAAHSHGFLKDGTSYTTIDVPGATETFATGINNSGTIVGYYFINDSHIGGFLYTTPHAVPEPSTLVMVGCAAACLWHFRRRGRLRGRSDRL